MTSENISLQQAAARVWDAVVIGAGPAGSTAAIHCARRGLRVLMLDRSRFPRSKVCGCCVNRRALALLRRAGLEDLPQAVELDELRIAYEKHSILVPGQDYGVAISRGTLDATLVSLAVARGASFLDGAAAKIGPVQGALRVISVDRGTERATLLARVVVGTAGLGARLSDESLIESIPASRSRLGAGATVENATKDFRRGTIYMACGEEGYVGMVRVEEDRLNLAAALEPTFVLRSGGLGAAAARILERAELPDPGCGGLVWRGTPHLMRSPRRPAAERILLAGDAAGYVEPLTGEGIAWALTTGEAVADFVERGCRRWSIDLQDAWGSRITELIGTSRTRCRFVTRALRCRPAALAAFLVLSRVPPIASQIVRWFGIAPEIGRGMVAQ